MPNHLGTINKYIFQKNHLNKENFVLYVNNVIKVIKTKNSLKKRPIKVKKSLK